MLSENEWLQFRIEIEQMLEGLATLTAYRSNEFTMTRIVGTTIANSIIEVFSPVTSYMVYSDIPFSNKININDLLATSNGRQSAYYKIFDSLKIKVLNESERLVNCIEKVVVSSGKSKEEIKERINERIQEYELDFKRVPTYAEKNQVLKNLREFYDEIRDVTKLEEFVYQNYPSNGLR